MSKEQRSADLDPHQTVALLPKPTEINREVASRIVARLKRAAFVARQATRREEAAACG